ncbi:restriction endonuclease [Brevundimonas diminuta]|uniref:restriction endonuclease n=1 Tax=Brevundimonas diminuta TaxID=293 RepID=UPI00168BA00B|nr:restriction endonuclease [Brevundimonas diminuta]MBD3574023.1 restriction endonuclease [Brevundimonas diminuta]
MPSFAFRTSLSEDSGVRAGLSLTEEEMLAHLAPVHPMRESLEKDVAMRVASDVYADTVGDLLFALGAVEEPGMPTITQRMGTIFGGSLLTIYDIETIMQIEALGVEYSHRRANYDPSKADILAEIHGLVGSKSTVRDALEQALELHYAFNPYLTRQDVVGDLAELQTLFASETLPADPDRFFDQRFINYLHANPDRLPQAHWRQFEGLTAEWFSQQGYEVELGAGRNDDGIDVRAWRTGSDRGGPAGIIVQCKRHKEKIDKTVVKALHSDVVWNGAEEGMIVTTNDISPGAAKTIDARRYPISAANRTEVQRWVTAMRRPWSGVVAGGMPDPTSEL